MATEPDGKGAKAEPPAAPPPIPEANDTGSLQCAVCLSELTEPATTRCGHTFCVHCLPPTLRACPLCRDPLDVTRAPKVNVTLRIAVRAGDPARYDARVAATAGERLSTAARWAAHLARRHHRHHRRRHHGDVAIDIDNLPPPGSPGSSTSLTPSSSSSSSSDGGAPELRPLRPFTGLLDVGTLLVGGGASRGQLASSSLSSPSRTTNRGSAGAAAGGGGRGARGARRALSPRTNADRCTKNCCLFTLAAMFLVVLGQAFVDPGVEHSSLKNF
jgi:hypothetical protein